MVHAAIIGTALGGGVAGPTRSLWIDGLDVLRQPGTTGNGYSVPVKSIRVQEAGYGGVSSMTFTLNDPLAVVTLQEGATVRYHDHGTNLPDFVGWLQGPIETAPKGIGRVYSLRATGPEILLDWLVLGADVTWAASTSYSDAVLGTVAQCVSGMSSPLRAFNGSASPGAGTNSTQAAPTSELQGPPAARLVNALTLTAGTTLRECLRMIGDDTDTNNAGGFGSRYGQSGPFVTVDMWYGLRTWGFGADYHDAATLTMNDVTPGPILAARLRYTRDVTSVPRAVYVKGGNAAGSGLVTDGSGDPGPTAVLSDSSITTAAARDLAAAAYLAQRRATLRGTVRRDTFVNTDTVTAHVVAGGSSVTITDAQLPGSPIGGTIMGIGKTYLPGDLEVWDITFGQLPPSLPRELRRLTRTVLS